MELIECNVGSLSGEDVESPIDISALLLAVPVSYYSTSLHKAQIPDI